MAFMGQAAPAHRLGQLQRPDGCLPLRGDEASLDERASLQATPAPMHISASYRALPLWPTPMTHEIFKAT
jgi:hypothetical protein